LQEAKAVDKKGAKPEVAKEKDPKKGGKKGGK